MQLPKVILLYLLPKSSSNPGPIKYDIIAHMFSIKTIYGLKVETKVDEISVKKYQAVQMSVW